MAAIKNNFYYIYLLLALVGGGFTWYFAIQGVVANNGNFSIIALIQSTWINNFYAKSITLDFWTAATVGSIFMVVEGLRIKLKWLWVYIVCTFMVAFAFAFPMFLFFRAIHLKNKSVNIGG